MPTTCTRRFRKSRGGRTMTATVLDLTALGRGAMWSYAEKREHTTRYHTAKSAARARSQVLVALNELGYKPSGGWECD